MTQPVLVIHGGTGIRATDKRIGPIRRNLRAISEKAYGYLASHTALETVSYTVRMLEDDPLFNAGTGSSLQEDGRARMSAAIMDGVSRRFAAVVNIERVRHPVLVADALLDEPDRILTGAGATRFARAKGFGTWNAVSAARLRQWRQRQAAHGGTRAEKHGTVGALALDGEGRLAAATSTGGRGFERVGRVSDSAMPPGNYATTEAAVSCTGVGEDIVDEAVAVRIIQRVADGAALAKAVERTFGELRARKRQLGAVALDRKGQWAWETTAPLLCAVARVGTRWAESY